MIFLKKYIIFLFLFHVSLFLSGQEKIDSLKKTLLKADEKEQLIILNKLSESYIIISPEKSIEYAKKALEYSIKNNNKLFEARSLMNLGNGYYYIGNIDKAKNLYLNSKSLFDDLNDLKGVSDNIKNLGNIQFAFSNYDSAEVFYKKAIGIKKDIDDFYGLYTLYTSLSSVYLKIKDYNNAEKYLSNSLQLSGNIPLKDVCYTYLMLSQLYEQKNQFKNSLKYHKLYSITKDSIYSKEKASLGKDVSYGAQKQEIEALSKNEILQQEKIDIQKTVRNIFILGVVLILLFTGLIYYNYRNKIKANKILSLQNNQIRKKNRKIKNQAAILSRINSELEKLSIVASKTDNAILITSADGSIEWINDGFTRLFGYTLEDFFIEQGRTLVSASSNPNIQEIIELARKEKKSQIYQSEVIAKSGRKYITQTTLTPIIDDNSEIIKFIIIDSDITKLKNTEEELQKLLITKDKFFTIIAHDLKNPFNTLIGLTQLLVHGFDRMSTEKVKHFHQSLHQISKNGYELLINLLEWARSQMGRMEFQPEQQNLYKLTTETFSLYNSKAEQKEILLTNNVHKDSFAYADINMIKTIFRNLVSNALKFTDHGGVVEISSQTNGELVEVTIRDTGIGIEPNTINNLFKLDVHRSTQGTDNEMGTGLGLLLCKEFIEKHKGKIWAESKVGFGTKFIFTLPLNKSSGLN